MHASFPMLCFMTFALKRLRIRNRDSLWPSKHWHCFTSNFVVKGTTELNILVFLLRRTTELVSVVMLRSRNPCNSTFLFLNLVCFYKAFSQAKFMANTVVCNAERNVRRLERFSFDLLLKIKL